MNFGEKLVYLRKEHNLSQGEVANAIGVSQASYSRYETNRGEMDYKGLVAIADLYKVSLDYLFGRTHNPYTSDKYSKEDVEAMLKFLSTYHEVKRNNT